MNTATDIFSIARKARRTSPRPWVAVWPCGSEFELQQVARGEWECPEYKDGDQTGMTIIEPTRGDLASVLMGMGCTIQKGYSK